MSEETKRSEKPKNSLEFRDALRYIYDDAMDKQNYLGVKDLSTLSFSEKDTERYSEIESKLFRVMHINSTHNAMLNDTLKNMPPGELATSHYDSVWDAAADASKDVKENINTVLDCRKELLKLEIKAYLVSYRNLIKDLGKNVPSISDGSYFLEGVDISIYKRAGILELQKTDYLDEDRLADFCNEVIIKDQVDNKDILIFKEDRDLDFYKQVKETLSGFEVLMRANPFTPIWSNDINLPEEIRQAHTKISLNVTEIIDALKPYNSFENNQADEYGYTYENIEEEVSQAVTRFLDTKKEKDLTPEEDFER